MAALFRVMMTGLVLFAATANAQAADPALVDQVKDAVIKELRESGAIDREIDAGIARYVERQRAEAAQNERREADKRVAALRQVSKGRDHIRGDTTAAVTLVEYSDFECPFCKRFHATAKRLVDESKGQVNWVYRHFPLDELHPGKARKEAVASECAAEIGGNVAFWKFADRFFELTPSNNRTDIDTVLPQIAGEIGLDKARFASCLSSGRHDRRIEEDVKDAVASGGQGTPWSFIVSKSGKAFPLSGAQPYAAVKQLVDLALEKK
ncbi:MAG: thioredoxin domain-containing protein [Burkholderiales bacterium]|nr:thioredoxin domain-containing protein [Burkholderiales bacterium]